MTARASSDSAGGMSVSEELVGLVASLCQARVEGGRPLSGGRRRRGRHLVRETQVHSSCRAGRDVQGVVGGHLGAIPIGIHCIAPTVDDGLLDAVLHERAGVGRSEQPLRVGLVLA